ncbi:MAG: DNA internalization-related competence protein ComEC/Rec2 [Eubacterium sp.]|nr:DNA internalization-related competence protein ComEC/Rec2 [Eubacterium sp.]
MRRPIWLSFLFIIICIFFFYDPPDEDEFSDCAGQTALYAVIADITGSGDDKILELKEISDGQGKQYSLNVRAYISKDNHSGKKKCSFDDLKIGNSIKISGSLKTLKEPGNPGQFNEKEYYLSMGVGARIFAYSVVVTDEGTDIIADLLCRARGFFSDAFYTALPDTEAGILCAMLLGERSGLDEEIKDLYTSNGIAHILAISGLHISLIGAGLFFILRRYVMPMHFACAVTGIILFLYAELTGFSLSTWRAVIMMLIMLGARFLGVRYDRLNALSLAGITELVINPCALFQSGFWLSYGTVFGIIIFVDEFRGLKLQSHGRTLSFIFDFISGSLGVFLITFPMIIQSYYEFPVFSVIINAVILPLMSVLIIAGIAGGTMFLISSAISEFLFGTVYYILRLYRMICELVVSLPHSVIITGHRGFFSVILYYVIMALVILFIDLLKKRNKKRIQGRIVSVALKHLSNNACFFLIISVLVINITLFILPVTATEDTFFNSFSLKGLSITNLDIGQGDCTCIRLKSGETILIDGGSSDIKEIAKYRIVPFLKYYGIGRIDHMIMTHSDEDHISGIKEIIEREDHFGLELGSLIMPDISKPDDNYKSLEQAAKEAKGLSLIKIKAGDELRLHDVRLFCLHPYLGYDHEDANDYSTVIGLEYGAFFGIFMGDLGFRGEREMIRYQKEHNGVLRDVDYLKVGHHGSKTSSSEELLSIIRPEIAVASAGFENRYHHPANEAVERIEKSGARFYCTKDSGAVTTFTDGESINVYQFKLAKQ